MVSPLTRSGRDSINRLLPYQSHFLTVDGLQMHYLDEGPREAPVVLCLHGNPTWCYYYRNLVKDLSSRFRVIVPDYLGCGLSDHPTDQHFRAIDRIRQIQSFIDQLGLKRFSLVMHDWGGSIGTGLAVRNVDAIEKLIYLNTTLTETESLPKIIKTAAKPFIGKFLTKFSMRFLKLTTTLGVCQKLSKEVREGYYYPYRSIARRTAIWDFVADIPFDGDHPSYNQMLDLAARVPALWNLPVKIIWGLRDPCFHREMLDKVARHFPQAEILEIPDASHLVLEDAREVTSEAILEFLLSPASEGVLKTTRPSNQVNALFNRFMEMAHKYPQNDAVVVPSLLFGALSFRHLNYSDMVELITKYRRGLASLGLTPGDRVLMMVQPGIDFLALSYAVMGSGASPVFMDPGMGRAKLFKCIKALNPDAIIGAPKAQLLRLKAKALFPNLKFFLTASDWIYFGGRNLSFLKKFSSKELAPIKAPAEALIAYTSGATGAPKGVVFTNQMLEAQARIFSEDFGLEPGRDLPLLPVFSIYNMAVGVSSVIPPINPAKPLELEADQIVRIVNDLGVHTSFGSPTLWNKIAEYCFRTRQTLPSMKKIFMAGAPVSDAVLEQVKNIVPNAEVYTPYGSTESLPVTLASAAELRETKRLRAKTGEEGTLVGKALSRLALKIVAISFEAETDLPPELAPLEIGEIIVRGDNVSPRYLDDHTANSLGKIPDGNGNSWHRMGDVGYLDQDGNLFFCGRKAHMVSFEGRNFYSVPVERVFNRHKKVKRSALIKLGESGEPAIVIEPHSQHWPVTRQDIQELVSELRELGRAEIVSRGVKKFLFHKSFPVDPRHNAKIYRDELGKWSDSAECFEARI